MKKLTAIMMSIVLAAAAVTGCGASKEGAGQEQGSAEAQDAAASEAPTVLEDGVYTAEFNTDSSMFRVNDTKDGRGILIVTGGRMAISHCQNEEMARRLRKAVHDKWPESRVSIHATRGLDSFYAERGGLIAAY